MTSIKRKTFALVVLAVLVLLVAPGCNDSSASVPADSTDSTVIDTNVSTSTSPDTADPIPDVDGASDQTDSEPQDDEPVDNLTSDKLSLLPKIMASESATDINEETLELGTFYSDCSQDCGSVVYFWDPSCEGCIEGLQQLQNLYEKYRPVQFYGVFSFGSGDNEQDPRKIIEDKSITFPNLADHDMTVLERYLDNQFYEPAAEDVVTLPALFVISKSPAQLVYSIGRPIDSERLDNYLAQALSN